MDSDDEDSSYILRAEREAKQNYLKEEILENNYDPELFMWYISSVGEADIDAWDFDSLQGVVSDFKMKYRRGQTLDEVRGPREKSDIEIKQEYLHAEILQSGYDTDLFMWYIEGLGEPDINIWTFDSLKEAVHNFKLKYKIDDNLEKILAAANKPNPDPISSPEPVKPQDPTSISSTPHTLPHIEKAKAPDVVNKMKELKEKDDNIKKKDKKSNQVTAGLTQLPPEQVTILIEEKKLNHIEKDSNFVSPSMNHDDLKEDKEKNIENPENLDKVGEDNEIIKEEALDDSQIPVADQAAIVLTDPKPESLVDTDSLIVLPCNSLHETEISLYSDLAFKCGSPKLQKSGFFSKKFIEYELTTPSLGWRVKRRYSDFIWLRDTLISTNPGSYVPPLPSKKMMGNFEQQFIKKRQKLLNDFICTILRDPLLRSSTDLIVFLKEENPNSLRLHQQTRVKLIKPTKLDDICTLNGDTICDMNEDPALFDLLSDYLDVSEALEHKLKTSTKSLISSTKKLSNTINEFAEMIQEYNSSLLESGLADKQADVMEGVSNALIKWAAHEEINGKNMEDDLKLHFDFKVKEKSVFKQMIQERSFHFTNYKKLRNKKNCESLIENARNLFGHFNYKIRSEFERNFGDQILYDTEHFKTLANHEIEKAISLEALWTVTSDFFYQAPKLI